MSQSLHSSRQLEQAGRSITQKLRKRRLLRKPNYKGAARQYEELLSSAERLDHSVGQPSLAVYRAHLHKSLAECYRVLNRPQSELRHRSQCAQLLCDRMDSPESTFSAAPTALRSRGHSLGSALAQVAEPEHYDATHCTAATRVEATQSEEAADTHRPTPASASAHLLPTTAFSSSIPPRPPLDESSPAHQFTSPAHHAQRSALLASGGVAAASSSLLLRTDPPLREAISDLDQFGLSDEIDTALCLSAQLHRRCGQHHQAMRHYAMASLPCTHLQLHRRLYNLCRAAECSLFVNGTLNTVAWYTEAISLSSRAGWKTTTLELILCVHPVIEYLCEENHKDTQQQWLQCNLNMWALLGFLLCCVLRDFRHSALLLRRLGASASLAELLTDVQYSIEKQDSDTLMELYGELDKLLVMDQHRRLLAELVCETERKHHES